MHSILRRIFDDALHILAPRLCPSCHTLLTESEHGFCASCHISLDAAPFPQEIYQELLKRFARNSLFLSAIGSRYIFLRDSPVESIIYAIKYQGCYDLAVCLGREVGKALRMFREFDDVDTIVPVPLHRAKRRVRGYNQSEAIANGIGEVMKLRVVSGVLVRNRHTESQTQLNARERLLNVIGAFGTTKRAVVDKTVMLCDDVFTTGATLNACAKALLDAGAARVVAATIATDQPDNDATNNPNDPTDSSSPLPFS